LTPRVAERLKDADGLTFETVRRQAGCAGTLAEVCLPANHYGAFVELHIEQGPLLERERIPIGIVTAIAAPASLRVQIYGKGGHAGAVLMPERQDALCAAAEIILAVENTAKASGSSDAVATTGVCHVHPGAINSIPSEVRLQVDVRDIDLTMRDRLLEHIRHAVEETSHRRGTKSAVELLNADPPVRVSSQVVKAIETACRHLAFSSKQMVSRAYHDALFMAQICPTGMIFIPCKDGISHRPEEYASPASIGCGVEVLALTLAQLSEGLGI
jgi:N-carbamoyl-L-amino-acid hydrolase